MERDTSDSYLIFCGIEVFAVDPTEQLILQLSQANAIISVNDGVIEDLNEEVS